MPLGLTRAAVRHRRPLGYKRIVLAAIILSACGSPESPKVGITLFGGLIAPNSFDPLFRLAASEMPRLDLVHATSTVSPVAWSPEHIIAVSEELTAREDVIAVVQMLPSRLALASAPLFERVGVPNVLAVSTSPLLGEVGPYTFPLPPDDRVQGRFLSCIATDRFNARRTALFYVDNEYGLGIREAVVEGLRERGAVLSSDRAFDQSSDPALIVDEASHLDMPDVAVIAGYTLQAATIGRLLHERVPTIRMILSDGVGSTYGQLLPLLGSAASNAWLTTASQPDPSHPMTPSFLATYDSVIGGTPNPTMIATYATGLDAFSLIVNAVAAEGATREGVARYLRSLGRSRQPYTGILGDLQFPNQAPHWYTASKVSALAGFEDVPVLTCPRD